MASFCITLFAVKIGMLCTNMCTRMNDGSSKPPFYKLFASFHNFSIPVSRFLRYPRNRLFKRFFGIFYFILIHEICVQKSFFVYSVLLLDNQSLDTFSFSVLCQPFHEKYNLNAKNLTYCIKSAYNNFYVIIIHLYSKKSMYKEKKFYSKEGYICI